MIAKEGFVHDKKLATRDACLEGNVSSSNELVRQRDAVWAGLSILERPASSMRY